MSYKFSENYDYYLYSYYCNRIFNTPLLRHQSSIDMQYICTNHPNVDISLSNETYRISTITICISKIVIYRDIGVLVGSGSIIPAAIVTLASFIVLSTQTWSFTKITPLLGIGYEGKVRLLFIGNFYAPCSPLEIFWSVFFLCTGCSIGTTTIWYGL